MKNHHKEIFTLTWGGDGLFGIEYGGYLNSHGLAIICRADTATVAFWKLSREYMRQLAAEIEKQGNWVICFVNKCYLV